MGLLRLLLSRRGTAGSSQPVALTALEQRMHDEFVRPDFLDRLTAFHGLEPDDVLTREHFASFDAHRLAEHRRALAAENDPVPPGDAG